MSRGFGAYLTTRYRPTGSGLVINLTIIITIGLMDLLKCIYCICQRLKLLFGVRWKVCNSKVGVLVFSISFAWVESFCVEVGGKIIQS